MLSLNLVTELIKTSFENHEKSHKIEILKEFVYKNTCNKKKVHVKT